MENKTTKSGKCEQLLYSQNNSYASRVLEVLQALRKDEVFCDVTLETEDGTKIKGHKVIFASSSPYFKAMFNSFKEKNNDRVIIKQLDSNALILIVDFIYTGKIMFTVENVQVLLAASNLLQLDDIQDACCAFLITQLDATNCLGIRSLADLHSCMGLFSSSESYIKQHFLNVVQCDEFLSLSFEQLIELISSDVLTVTSEEKVFECVVCWVNHEPISREEFFPKLLKYVRFPLLTKEYLMKTVINEPYMKNKPECLNNITHALDIHLLKYDQPGTIQNTTNTTPRRPFGPPKVILKISDACIESYDPVTNQWKFIPKISMPDLEYIASFTVLNDGSVIALDWWNEVEILGFNTSNLISTTVPCWKHPVPTLVLRAFFGVAKLNNCIFAVGGYDTNKCVLNSAEVYNLSTREWRMISSMSTGRFIFGIGVLDNLIYVVGGMGCDVMLNVLKSVERYDPYTDTWTPVADMCENRHGVGIGVLDGLLYAVGGRDRSKVHKSVEAYNPRTGIWISVADMHMGRSYAGVVVLNGLLYVMGGFDGTSDDIAPVEVYNPHINTWTVQTSMN